MKTTAPVRSSANSAPLCIGLSTQVLQDTKPAFFGGGMIRLTVLECSAERVDGPSVRLLDDETPLLAVPVRKDERPFFSSLAAQ